MDINNAGPSPACVKTDLRSRSSVFLYYIYRMLCSPVSGRNAGISPHRLQTLIYSIPYHISGVKAFFPEPLCHAHPQSGSAPVDRCSFSPAAQLPRQRACVVFSPLPASDITAGLPLSPLLRTSSGFVTKLFTLLRFGYKMSFFFSCVHTEFSVFPKKTCIT